jgi:UDP-N-acetylglucosamine 2-epimerase (non-hydrolysing)
MQTCEVCPIRIMTIFGTRPEIIRLSLIFKILDDHAEHVMVHTGQNYSAGLSDVFFQELSIRAADLHLGIEASRFGVQAAAIIERTDAAMERIAPDRVLILGDTNSGLSAIAAARRGIPVFHLEAGNRCYDDRVPEEINRRIIDHSSSVLMPYTQRSMENLVREGIERERIYVVGNPIGEVIRHFDKPIQASTAVERLGIADKQYMLATLHRAENVDEEERLTRLIDALHAVVERFKMPLIVSTHPRTADRLRRSAVASRSPLLRLIDPLGFFDFINLERRAWCVLTDSGTVQEECSIFRVPNVTLRDVTERPETVEVGSNVLAGSQPDVIVDAVRIATDRGSTWQPPADYLVPNPSTAIAKIVLGHLSVRRFSS